MSVARFMRQRAGEILLVFVSAWAMAQVGFNAYYIDGVQHTPLAPALVALFVLELYLASYRRKSIALGFAFTAVLAAVVVGAAMVLSVNEGGPQVDEEGNYLYFALVIVVTSVACFLLTRTVAGCAVWFVAVAFLCSVVQAFYLFDEHVFSLAASSSALVLVVYRNFTRGMLGAQVLGKMNRPRAFAGALVPVAGALCLALVAWFAVIAPLNPGVLEVKLITDYRQYPVEELKGTVSERPVFDTSLTTDKLVDGERYTTDDLYTQKGADDKVDARALKDLLQEQQQGNADAGEEDGEGNQGASSDAGMADDLDPNSIDPEFEAIDYSDEFPFVWIGIALLVLLAAGIAAYFVLRRRARRARLERLLDAQPKDQLSGVYLFCLERLGRLGFRVPEGTTLSEYARTSARSMDVLTAETGVPFETVTRSYVECSAYGGREVTDEDLVGAVAFYDGLWRGARSYLGNFRYFFRSFRL